MQDGERRFWAWIAERHAIYLRRAAGKPAPWTSDPILQRYKFTNVFRELDRTTLWFSKNLRDPLRTDDVVTFATIAFRFFNRIETAQRLLDEGLRYIFEQPHLWKVPSTVRNADHVLRPHPPYVTGSYIIKGPEGIDKLAGCLWCIRNAADLWCRHVLNLRQLSLEDATRLLQTSVPYLGPFMAYEVVSDLRHTSILGDAPDIRTWANPGPGARRGLARVFGRGLKDPVPRNQLVAEMRSLHDRAWIREDYLGEWLQHVPTLEMREIEHSLCEFDKYERVRLGQGRPRGTFRPQE